MADIILPQVDLLTSTDDNTNVLVEQGGQINRVNKSLFGSSDAETLNGYAASYFAPATSLSTTNTNVSSLSTRVSTIEGDYLTSSDIVDYSGDISDLDTRVTTLESSGGGITRTLLWSAPSSYEDSGASSATLSLNDSLANYDEIVISQVWTYFGEQGWAYNSEPHFTIDQSSLTDTSIVMGWGNYYEGFRYLTYKTATSLSMSKGYDGDWASNSYCQVPGAIYGIKYN